MKFSFADKLFFGVIESVVTNDNEDLQEAITVVRKRMFDMCGYIQKAKDNAISLIILSLYDNPAPLKVSQSDLAPYFFWMEYIMHVDEYDVLYGLHLTSHNKTFL